MKIWKFNKNVLNLDFSIQVFVLLRVGSLRLFDLQIEHIQIEAKVDGW